MEDFSSRYTLLRALKNAFIVHVLVVLFLFLYYNPPSLLFSPEKPKENDSLKKEKAQVLIAFDKEDKPAPQPQPKPKTQPRAENLVVPLPPHSKKQTEPLTLAAPSPMQTSQKTIPPLQPQAKQAPAKPEPTPSRPKLNADQILALQENGEQAESAQEKNEPITEKAPVMFAQIQAPATGSGKPRTFADLARGFMHHVQQENNDAASAGNAQAQVQQILHDTYHAKVYGLLKQAVNAERPQLYIHNTSNEQATLLLKIARNGTLLYVAIHHPAKKDGVCTLGTLAHDLQSIEATLGRIAKNVGLYPPLPTAFKADTISITFPIGINTQQGFYSYFMT